MLTQKIWYWQLRGIEPLNCPLYLPTPLRAWVGTHAIFVDLDLPILLASLPGLRFSLSSIKKLAVSDSQQLV